MNKRVPTDSYRSIFKATSLFGGVQVFNIIITIARAKIVAVLLGSEGMGLNGLFLNAISLIRNGTNLGLPQSAVKEIAQANALEDKQKVTETIAVFRKLIWFTAFLALAVSVLLGNQLSKWVFGSGEYTVSFMLLGVTFVFGTIATGTFTVLRGLGRLRYLATSQVLGPAFGLLISIPFYYYFGIKGVVPAIIASSIIGFIIARYFERKLDITPYVVTFKKAFTQGKEMIKLGVVLSSTAFLATGVSFVISAFVTRTGSLADLGYYNAAYSITAGYTGVVFTAMTTDYFPRMSAAVSKSGTLWKRLVNEQTHLLTLILTPLLLLLITALPWIVRILLTDEFLVIESFISFLVLGILLQGPTWSLGIIIIAKGDLKTKMYSEIAGHTISLILSLTFYYYWGLWGLGLGFFLSKLFGFLMTYLIARWMYRFSFDNDQTIMFFVSFSACAVLAATQLKLGYPLTYIVGGVLLLISATYSAVQLNHKLGLRRIVSDMISKRRNK